MKLTLTKTLGAAFVGLSLLIGSSPNSVSGQQPGNSDGAIGDFSKRSIQGVWLVVVQRKHCQTGDLIGPPGRGLLTFAEGGTISETTAPGALPPNVALFRSGGHGVWERQSWSHYPVTMISQRLKADGTFDGWAKIVATFELAENGNTFTSVGTFEIITPSGDVLDSGCSVTTGTRLR